MGNCPIPDPPPTYDPEFLVEEWLSHSEAFEQAHNVEQFARYAPEVGWPSILAVLQLPDAQSHVSALAYALRMLIARYGASFIDRIEAEAAINPAFRACLAEVRPDPTFPLPEALWPRLSAAAGTSIGPMAPHMASLYAEMPDLSELASWDPNPLSPENVPALGPEELAAQARAWVQYAQTFWAWEELNRIHDVEGLDAAWPFVLSLIEKASDHALAPIGAGILERRESRRIGPRGRPIHRRGRLVGQRFMGPEFVVLAPEGIEAALLVPAGRGRGARRRPLERPVHPLVAAVLLRLARLDQLGIDPQPHPPDAELGEAAERPGGKRDAVVGTEDFRESVLSEQPLEDGPALSVGGAGEAATGEQVPAEAVLDGERVAVAPVAGLKLPLEVGRPDPVGRDHRGQGPAGMAGIAAAPARIHEPVPA
jgi:hypothetical protein